MANLAQAMTYLNSDQVVSMHEIGVAFTNKHAPPTIIGFRHPLEVTNTGPGFNRGSGAAPGGVASKNG